MDSDMLALRNLDVLFSFPTEPSSLPIAAGRDFSPFGEAGDSLNGGLFVLQPSRERAGLFYFYVVLCFCC